MTTQKDKELLIKDLCAMLPYGVKILDISANVVGKLFLISTTDTVQYETHNDTGIQTLYNIKPYLFPLSSITEGQKDQISQLLLDTKIEFSPYEEDYVNLLVSSIKQSNALINYCLTNHLDINGLIEKGLAIDATGLNIY